MAEAVRVPLLVITGPVGVGTFAVAAEVSDRLDAAGVAHALVDVDALRWCYLRPSADPYRVGLAMRNLAAVWDTFRAAGATGLVLADVVIARADLDRYREAVPGAEFTVVRLHAHPETLAARVGAREVIRRGAWYLLAIHNNRAPENKGKWTFLGGLIDPPDPSPEAALVRELREELGVDGRVLGEVERYPYRNDPGPCVVLLADFEGEPRPNEEILALRWFTRDEVEAISRAGLLQMGLELDAIRRAEHAPAGG
jgi:8-oxo-dGTP pyrophosphatase MutT (NUDIX family)